MASDCPSGRSSRHRRCHDPLSPTTCAFFVRPESFAARRSARKSGIGPCRTPCARRSTPCAIISTAGSRLANVTSTPTPLRPMHAPNQFDLLRQRRFAPFFWTQFLAAANDNVFKNAFVVFVAFAAASLTAIDAGMIVNLIGAIFIVPFMLFSATVGQLADKYEKSALIRLIKLFT